MIFVNALKVWLSLYQQTLRQLSPPLWVLNAVGFINFLGMVVLTFLPVHLREALDLSMSQVGLVMTCYGAGAIAGGFLTGRVLKVLHPLKVLQLWFVAQAVGYFSIGLIDSALGLASVLAFTGVFASGFRPALNLLMGQFATKENKASSFSVYMVAINLASACGLSLAGYLMEWSFFWVCLLDSLTCLGATILLYSKSSLLNVEIPAEKAPEAHHAQHHRRFLVFLGCVGLFTLLFFQAPTVFPIYATEVYGISTGTLGWLLGLASLLLVFVQIPFVELVKKKNPYLIAAGGILIFCWGYGLLPLGETLLFLVISTLVRAVGSMVIFPKIMGILLSDFDHGHRGSSVGLYQSVFAFAQFVGPALGAQTYAMLGPSAYWWLFAGLGSLVAGSFVLLARRCLLGFEPTTMSAQSERCQH